MLIGTGNILIEKAKFAFGCKTNKELANMLGVKESAFYEALKREKPLRNKIVNYVLELHQNGESPIVSLDWLLGINISSENKIISTK